MFSELSSVGNIVNMKMHKKQPSFKELLYSSTTSPLFDQESEEIRKLFDKFINTSEVKQYKSFLERNKKIGEMANHSHHLKFLKQVNLENCLLNRRNCREKFSFGLIGQNCKEGNVFMTRMSGHFDDAVVPIKNNNPVQVKMKYMDMQTCLSFVDLSVQTPWNDKLPLLHTQYTSLNQQDHYGIALLIIDTVHFNQQFILEQLQAITRDFHSIQPKSSIILLGINTKERNCLLTQTIPLGKDSQIPLSRDQCEKIAEKLGCFTYLEADIESENGLDHLKQLLFKTFFIIEELNKTH